MTPSNDTSKVNRREFLKHSGAVAAGAAVLGTLTPGLHRVTPGKWARSLDRLRGRWQS